jgi:RecB family endonuclease NucS
VLNFTFKTEFDLEEFVWANLEPLFNLKPLARQYGIQGQFCDILATTPEQQLVVLELKNVEDRYVVQQLTRYYASLRQAQPFAGQIDYSLPIRLIAIAPTFHAHNYIDREYNRLDLEFYRFSLAGDGDRFRFQLVHADSAAETAVEVGPSFYPYLRSLEDESALWRICQAL